MKVLLEKILGRRRVLVKENERVVQLYKGELKGILLPGEYSLPNRRNRLSLEMHNLSRPELTSAYDKVLFDKLPKVAAEHLTEVETRAGEVAVVERDGRIHSVLAPDSRIVVWSDAGPWSVTRIDVSEVTEVDPALMRRLGQAKAVSLINVIPVADGQAGILFADGVLIKTLQPGVHAFWAVGRTIQQKLVDLKRQSLEVSGQELLTRDRVTIRVNLAAEYRVTDPVKAVTSVKDFADSLYRALQLAFRKTLGAMTLDQILENKGLVDNEAADKVRAEMAEIGVEVSEITLKDVILPGEMRDILNTVVAAQKEAEANVIRRREETNATRSLLNTAKVMAENPVMLRLKELEALENIAGKVERLTVMNGTDGLMNDLVRLRADAK
ncbi:MAG: slipin family protein [Nitratireductor sp.]|nr:slipin family protein [Nitratireductor sp.]